MEQGSRKRKEKKDNVCLDLNCIKIDRYGRVVVQDPKLAAEIQKAKQSGLEFVYLSANEGNYCVLPTGCPVTGQNVGCGCPTIPKPKPKPKPEPKPKPKPKPKD